MVDRTGKTTFNEILRIEKIGSHIVYIASVNKVNKQPPVGILLCNQKDHALLEYALTGMDNNLFVSKYLLELPKKEEMQDFIEEQMKEVTK